MFTGIVENVGTVVAIEVEQSNVHFTIESDVAKELSIDQSIAHNGACLTVVSCNERSYTVTAIDETLQKTNLGNWNIGDSINLERCIQLNGRLDGHMVQGHVDTVGIVTSICNENGSYVIEIQYENTDYITVSKGSITVNGISLTVVKSDKNLFSVAIIPYTWEHTNIHKLQIGSKVNLEFDIIGKYIAAYLDKVK